MKLDGSAHELNQNTIAHFFLSNFLQNKVSALALLHGSCKADFNLNLPWFCTYLEPDRFTNFQLR